MGKTSKCRVERLPKNERTVPTSKVVVLREDAALSLPDPSFRMTTDAVIEDRNANTFSPLSASFHPRQHCLPTVALPDEVLQRILRQAGTLAVVCATRVSSQWRRVALAMIKNTRRVDAATLFRQHPSHQISLRFVLQTLYAFSGLESLSFKNWANSLNLVQILSSVLLNYSSVLLSEIDLSGASFDAQELLTFLRKCPSLSTLRLSGCSCMDDATLEQIVAIKSSNISEFGSPPFALLDFSDCPKVSKRGIASLLPSRAVNVVVATKSTCRGLLYARNVTVTDLNLADSRNLYYVGLSVKPGALLSLNLSQCHSLTRISLDKADAAEDCLDLRSLNLAGASHLHDVELALPSTQGDGYEPDEDVIDNIATTANIPAAQRAIPNIEELSLFGARSLGPAFFRYRLGLAQPICQMPKLRVLDLNGCLGLNRLILVGYHCLESVDCSGCAHLDHLQIGDVPQMQKLTVRGKRAPLQVVEIVLPVSAVLLGMRDSWSWEVTDGLQRIMHSSS